MTDRQLNIGDPAPDFVLLGAHEGNVREISLGSLLEGHLGLLLTTYVLDFTGG